MKMGKYHYEIIRDAIKKLITIAKADQFFVRDIQDIDFNDYKIRYRIYQTALNDIIYDDNHPRYKYYIRYNEHIPGFWESFRDYNDSHIQTAINQIFKEITNV